MMDKFHFSCSKFSGYPYENGEKFLKEFESYSKLNDFDDDDDDSRKLAAFHLLLKGPALTWFLALGVDENSTWDNISNEFYRKYVRLDWQHPSVLVESENFHSLVLKPNQQIEDFYSNVYEKGQLLGKPEHEVMTQFIKGLPDKLAFYVRASKPNDTSEALTIAKTGEAYNYRHHDPSLASVQNLRVHPNELSEIKQQMSHLTETVSKLAMLQGTQPKYSFQSEQPRKSGACFKCNSPGHAKRNCNWNSQGIPNPQTSCQLCSQKGHDALRCKTLPQQKDNTSEQVCQICSTSGHTARTCTRGNLQTLGATGHDPLGGQ